MTKDYTELLSNSFTPNIMYMQLKSLRELPSLNFRKQVVDFLKEFESVPEEAVVVLTKDSISFLVDDNGNLLQFS